MRGVVLLIRDDDANTSLLQAHQSCENPRNIGLCFREIGDPIAGPNHGTLARVVGGERKPCISREHVEQPSEVCGSGPDVLLGIEWISHSETLSRLGHELHEPFRALGRHRTRVIAGLDRDDRMQ